MSNTVEANWCEKTAPDLARFNKVYVKRRGNGFAHVIVLKNGNDEDVKLCVANEKAFFESNGIECIFSNDKSVKPNGSGIVLRTEEIPNEVYNRFDISEIQKKGLSLVDFVHAVALEGFDIKFLTSISDHHIDELEKRIDKVGFDSFVNDLLMKHYDYSEEDKLLPFDLVTLFGTKTIDYKRKEDATSGKTHSAAASVVVDPTVIEKIKEIETKQSETVTKVTNIDSSKVVTKESDAFEDFNDVAIKKNDEQKVHVTDTREGIKEVPTPVKSESEVAESKVTESEVAESKTTESEVTDLTTSDSEVIESAESESAVADSITTKSETVSELKSNVSSPAKQNVISHNRNGLFGKIKSKSQSGGMNIGMKHVEVTSDMVAESTVLGSKPVKEDSKQVEEIKATEETKQIEETKAVEESKQEEKEEFAPAPVQAKKITFQSKEELTDEDKMFNKNLLHNIRSHYEQVLQFLRDSHTSQFSIFINMIEEVLDTNKYTKQWCPMYLDISDDLTSELYAKLYELDKVTADFNRKLIHQVLHLGCWNCSNEWDEDITFLEPGPHYVRCPKCGSERGYEKVN